MAEVITDGRIYAHVTEQGTAMPETALCARCVRDAIASGADAADMRDCTGNEMLTCQLCGYGAQPCEGCGAEAGNTAEMPARSRPDGPAATGRHEPRASMVRRLV